MDFEKLREVLPKISSTWTTSDIQIWLRFIGLESLIPQFKEHSVDGSCLSQLTQEDLKNELKIESKIIVKKIMAWISHGIRNFDEEIKSSKQLTTTIKGRQHKTSKSKQQFTIQQKISQRKINKLATESEQKVQMKRENTYNDTRKQQDNQLIIKQCDVVQAANFSLKQTGGMIGRHSTNQILVLDEFVSRFHAEIQFQNGQYYIRDCGSSSGTFIRITQKIELAQDMILQLGSNQFQIDLSKPDNIFMVVIEGPNIYQIYPISKKTKSSIGRKANNQISFPEDQHLSNIHATIFNIEGVWFIEDLGTTNGTWIRLSMEGVKSQRYLLDDKTQFKLSTNLTYQCRRNKGNRKTLKQKSQKCCYCGVADRNAIFIPCKHNIGCFECSSSLNLAKCNVCGSGITDLLKIFTV